MKHSYGDIKVNMYVCNLNKNKAWHCTCKCGKEIIRTTHELKRMKSCGCKSTYKYITSQITHGMSRKKVYHTWQQMKQRCGNKNHKLYKWYGGAGITVCKRWLKFDNFYKDMGEHPDGLSLDRINPNGNYEPSNCRWATSRIQALNKRKKQKIIGVYKSTLKSGNVCYIAAITHNYKKIYLGSFKTKIAAAKAYDVAAIKYHGEYAQVNFKK